MRGASHLGIVTSTSNNTWLLAPRGAKGKTCNLVPMNETLPKVNGPMVLFCLLNGSL